jgi:hypothetical protein
LQTDETHTEDDDMNSGTYDWVEAMMAIEAKRLAAQPKKTKKGKEKS